MLLREYSYQGDCKFPEFETYFIAYGRLCVALHGRGAEDQREKTGSHQRFVWIYEKVQKEVLAFSYRKELPESFAKFRKNLSHINVVKQKTSEEFGVDPSVEGDFMGTSEE